jgi:hypothetical protein
MNEHLPNQFVTEPEDKEPTSVIVDGGFEGGIELPPEAKIIIPNKYLEVANEFGEKDRLLIEYQQRRILGYLQLFGMEPKVEPPCRTSNDYEHDWRWNGTKVEKAKRDFDNYVRTMFAYEMYEETIFDILDDLKQKINEQQKINETEKIAVIEVGGGESHSAGPAWQPPRYSRVLSMTYGSSLKIIATDIKPQNISEAFRIYSVDDVKGTINMCGRACKEGVPSEHVQGPFFSGFNGVERILSEKMALISGMLRDKDLVVEDGVYRFGQLSGDEVKFLIEAGCKIEGGVNPNYRYFVRPLVDATYEKMVFGLNVMGGVDAFRLKDSFPNEKFNFIFAKSLNPWFQDRDWRSIGKDILASNGKTKIEIADFR